MFSDRQFWGKPFYSGIGNGGNSPPAGSVYFGPPSGGDDAPALQALADAEMVGLRRTIQFVPSLNPYLINSQLSVKLGWPKFRASPGVEIRLGLVDAGAAPVPAMFYVDYSYLAGTTNTTARAKMGNDVLTVDSITVPVITQGCHLEANYSQYEVLSITPNGGDFDLQLDRPLLFDAPLGIPVNVLQNYAHEWEFDGQGCTITGTGSRVFSLNRAWKCAVKNVIFSDAAGHPSQWASYDNAGYCNKYENIEEARTTSSGPVSVIAETNEGTVFDGLKMPLSPVYWDGLNRCELKNSQVERLWEFMTQGRQSCQNRLENVTGYYLLGSAGDTGTLYDGTTIQGSRLRGVGLNNTVVPCSKLKLERVVFDLPAFGFGALALGASVTAHVIVVDCEAVCDLAAAPVPAFTQSTCPQFISQGTSTLTVDIDGLTLRDVGLGFVQGNAQTTLRGKRIAATLPHWNGVSGMWQGNSGLGWDISLEDSSLNSNGAYFCFQNSAATTNQLRLTRSSIAGIRSVNLDAGIICLREDGATITGAVTGGGTLQRSKGTVTNAGASVNVNFAGIAANETPRVVQVTGTATPFKVAVSAGSKFTITGAAGDYAYSL